MFFAFLLFLSFAGTSVYSQTQNGTIRGVVKAKANDTVMSGVKVTLSGSSMMGTRTVISGESGEFLFPALLPGDYVVELSLDGFKSIRYVNASVKIGQTTVLYPTLELTGLDFEVLVDSVPAIIDVTSSSVSTHFDNSFLGNIPLSDRGWEEAVLKSPGIIDGQVAGFGKLFSSQGGSVVDNQSAFDGVINTSGYTNTDGSGIVFESIEQVQVLRGALPAEIGNVAGTYINIVTKSGGNEFHGEAAIYYEGKNFVNNNIDAELAQAGIDPPKLVDYDDWSFNFGGPVLKDRLWFDAAAGTENISRVVTGFPEDVRNKNFFGFGKLTWQPFQKHRFVAMYNRHDIKLNYDTRQPISFFSPEATRKFINQNEILKFKWTGILSPKALVDVDVSGNFQTRDNVAQDDAGNSYLETTTGFNFGGPLQESYVTQSRYHIKPALSLFQQNWAGSHSFKFGFEYERSRAESFAIKTFSPVSLHLLLAGQPLFALFANNINGVKPESIFLGRHGYAQDKWQVSDRVTLNLGVRFNNWTAFYPPQSSPASTYGPNVNFPEIRIERTIKAFTWNSFEPRLGAAIALDNEGAGVLRFGYSRYHHGLNQNFIVSGNPNFFILTTNPWNDINGDLVAQPNEVGPAISVTATSGGIAPNLKQPYTDEFSIGVEKRFFGDFSFGVNAFYRNSQDLIEDVNISANENSYVPRTIPDAGPDSLLGTADDRTLTVFNQVSNFQNILQVSNPELAERKSRGIEMTATKRMSRNWQLLGSLVWQKATGTVGNDILNSIGTATAFNDPNLLTNINGLLPLDRKWQTKINGIYKAPYGFTFIGYYQYLTGLPLYRTYNVILAQGQQTIVADPKDTYREADISQLDTRIEKAFSFGSEKMELRLTLDIFNVFNQNTVTKSQALSGTYRVQNGSFVPSQGGFGRPIEIQPPRTFRIGARFRF